MKVIIISGYNKETTHTIDHEVEQGSEIDFPIFNKTWIIAVPKEGHNYTRLKFDVFIERNLPIWHENYRVRTSITIGVIIGGVAFFIISFIAYVYIKILREQMKAKRSRAVIVPTANMSHDQTHLVHDFKPHDISGIDFDEGYNKTLESPKGGKTPGSGFNRTVIANHDTPHKHE